MTGTGIAILAFVTLQRLFELWLSNRNTRRLLAQGAVEHSPDHYPLIVAVHALWLACLWWFAPGQPINLWWLVLYAFVQIGRIWVLMTLGRRWTTRIIVLPDAPLVRSGPYAFCGHPNYLVVIAEIAILPLIFGLWKLALLFTLLNGAILIVRVRQENRALGR